MGELLREYHSGVIIIDGEQRCLNRCTFCSGTVKEGVTTESIFSKFLTDADYFIKNKYDEVEISGNDPLQFSKLVEVVEYLKKNGIKKIVLSTHGRHLKDLSLVESLAMAGLNSCRIPLYGKNEKIHNSMVQYLVEGEAYFPQGSAFNDSTEALKNCAKVGLKIKGHIVPTKYNHDSLNEVIDLYLDLCKEQLEELIIAAACISITDVEFTGDWYKPISELSDCIKSVLKHNIRKDYPHIFFNVRDFPYCSVRKLHSDIENKIDFPDIGKHIVPLEQRSDFNQHIPHYRVKAYFDKCERCIAYKLCAGIYKNDLDMFGFGQLAPITQEDLLNLNYLD